MQDYHSLKYLSKSAIDMLLDCPARYRAWREGAKDEEKTKALIYGGMFHTLVLEPKLFDTRYAVTDLNLTTKAGREFKDSLAPDIQIVKTPEYEAAQYMAEAVRNDPQCKFLFQDYNAEQSIFWERDGIQCKAKPDIIANVHGKRILADLKTCESAHPKDVQRSVANYHYHRQAYWYLSGMESIGQPCEAFIFVFVEKVYPHLVYPCVLDLEALEKGRDDCEKALDILKECQGKNKWPCYTSKIETISLPKWAA